MKTVGTSELRRRLREVLAELHEAAQPYFVLQYRRPVAVLIDVSAFESMRGRAKDAHPRIIRRSDISGGEPIIAGTRISVREIVQWTRAGLSVEDIAEGFPPLSPALVHDALSYFYDNPAEIEKLIAEAEIGPVLEAAGLELERVAPGIARARRRLKPSA